MLVWGALLFLPLLFAGYIFLSLGRAHVAKVEAQLLALNLARAGTFSSEFDTAESLNLMAALAHAAGFPAGVQPRNEVIQDFAGVGTLRFHHDTARIGSQSVDAYVELRGEPVTRLVSALGDIAASGFARARPEEFYVTMAMDNSVSLVKDRQIGGTLQAFGLSTSNPPPGGPGLHAALPFGTDLSSAIQIPWNELSTEVPPFSGIVSTVCANTDENSCQYGSPTHGGVLAAYSTDQYLAYKKAFIILMTTVAQRTALLDVNLLMTPVTKAMQRMVNQLFVGAPTGDSAANRESPLDFPLLYGLPRADADGQSPVSNMYLFRNTGCDPVWRYDQDMLSGLTQNADSITDPAQPLLVAVKDEERSRANPRNMFYDRVSMLPEQPAAALMQGTWSRKMIRYGQFFADRDLSTQVDLPESLLSFINPPFPTFENPPSQEGSWPPTDSFVYDHGPRNSAGFLQTATGVNTAPVGWLGMPGWWLGPGPAYPPNENLPPEIRDRFSYRCEEGVPESMNEQLSVTPGTVGRGLCEIVRYCYFAKATTAEGKPPYLPDCKFGDVTEEGWQSVRDYFYNSARPKSPRCPSGGEPGCLSLSGSSRDRLSYPFCLRGQARCAGHLGLGVPAGCFNGPGNNTVVFSGGEPERPRCDPGDLDPSFNPMSYSPPAGHRNLGPAGGPAQIVTTSPLYAGSMKMPDGSVPDIKTDYLPFLISDLVPMPGGTFTESCVAYAMERGRKFPPGRKALVLVTDGRPDATWFSGGMFAPDLVQNDALYLARFSDTLDQYVEEGGVVFTWLLGRHDRLEQLIRYIESIYLTLAKEQKDVFDDYISQRQEIPEDAMCGSLSCAEAFNSIPGTGMQGTTATDLGPYNYALNDGVVFGEFKTLMNDPERGRFWIESTVSASAGGVQGNIETFIEGLRGVLAQLKRQATLVY